MVCCSGCSLFSFVVVLLLCRGFFVFVLFGRGVLLVFLDSVFGIFGGCLRGWGTFFLMVGCVGFRIFVGCGLIGLFRFLVPDFVVGVALVFGRFGKFVGFGRT